MAAGRLAGVAVGTESAATSCTREEMRKEMRPHMCQIKVLERQPGWQHDGTEDPGWWWQQAADLEEGASSAPQMDTLPSLSSLQAWMHLPPQLLVVHVIHTSSASPLPPASLPWEDWQGCPR